MKKSLLALLLVALVAGGLNAQIAIGATGALHMDETMAAESIADRFQTGDGIWYGGFAELIMGQITLGASGNFSTYVDPDFLTEFIEYDAAAYLGYHLFGGRAFLDPFLEAGFGMMAQDFANEGDDWDTENPLAANLYWYGAAGLGVNLGKIGVFGKFAYNFLVEENLTATDEFGNEYSIPNYGTYTYDAIANEWKVEPYLPKYRFTLGLKLIL